MKQIKVERKKPRKSKKVISTYSNPKFLNFSISEIIKSDPYNILELQDIGITPQKIREAFLKKVLITHPDKGGNQENFREVKFAYNILIDPVTKKIYDKYGNKSISYIDKILKLKKLGETNSPLKGYTK